MSAGQLAESNNNYLLLAAVNQIRPARSPVRAEKWPQLMSAGDKGAQRGALVDSPTKQTHNAKTEPQLPPRLKLAGGGAKLARSSAKLAS